MRPFLDARYAVLGLIEGIVVALGFGARLIFAPGEASAGNAVLNAGLLTATVNLITSLFAELHEERAELLDIERKMVISERGHLFRTALYRAAQIRTLTRAVNFSVSAFVGASILIIPLRFVREEPLLGLLLPLIALFILGAYLGRQAASNPILWGAGMMLAGVLVTIVGRYFPV